MFVIKQPDTFKWPVTVHLPSDGGKHIKNTFTAVFRNMPTDAVIALSEEITKGLPDSETAKRVMVGWEDVKDEDGKTEIEFTTATFDRMLQIPTAAGAIIWAWSEAVQGGAKRKN